MCNINYPKYPARIFGIIPKISHGKDKAAQCDLCELCIHIKCNKLNYLDYRCLQNCDESWYCHIDCCTTIFLSTHQTTRTSWLVVQTLITTQWRDLEYDHGSSSLKPLNLEVSVNQFNNATPENSNYVK